MSDRGTLTVEIANVTDEQVTEFVRLFAWMNRLGNWGASRGAHISYDGDGGARAIIRVNGTILKDEDGAIDERTFSIE